MAEQPSLLEQAIAHPEPDEDTVDLPAPKVVEERQEDVLEVIEPSSEPVARTLVIGDSSKTYYQAPLKYFRKMEFMGLVGRTLDEAMSGEDGLTVNSIFGSDTPTTVGELSATDFGDLDSFLALAAKVANYAPEFLRDCYIIWLDVPKRERPWAREALENLDDDEGINIIEVFIDQNWKAIERFFTERIRDLANRVANQRKNN